MSSGGNQLPVCSFLGQFAFLKNEDPVGGHNGSEAVCDQDNCFSLFFQGVDDRFYLLFRFGIERGSRFVKDQYFRLMV